MFTINLHRIESILLDGGQLHEVAMMAVAPHSGPWREMVLKLKYHAHLDLAESLGQHVAQLIVAMGDVDGSCRNIRPVDVPPIDITSIDIAPIDTVSWIPTTDLRRRQRGFDHAELIARHVGVCLGRTAHKLLRRTSTAPQAGATRRRRLINPRYVAHPRCRGRHVLLIDDVTTTGATFREAARALLEKGAGGVTCCAVTYTPSRHR